ncbi:MAG: ABC transporter substrate-binding protein [Clostridiales Family XIII bacterium]|jgi:iron complex transport system substrate-binding protein|nr:ABC transporter substrate-binding protein [Clostridiales Family XIII bacterium]
MRKKFFAAILALALAGALLAGCSGGSGEAPAPAPAGEGSAAAPAEAPADSGGITLTDMTGREVTLEAPATRVVALTASDVEILYAIGAGDTLAGRGEYCNYPPEALAVQPVQSGNETNIEQIIALGPQLLLMGTMAQSEEQLKQLEAAGIAAFVTDAQNIEETYVSIELIGELMGRSAEAGEVVSDMQATLAELREKAAEAAEGDQKTIYFEVSPLEYGLWTSGADTFMDEVANLLGLRNIFGDVSGWAEVSEEQVLERSPDYIMTVGMYFGDGPTPIESLLARPGWESIPAINNRAILNLTADELSRPGPRIADGAKALYEFVYESGSATPNAQ